MTDQYDIVVVGGGTAGAFAAATAAREGMDTVLLERKSVEEAGHMACGDAIRGRSTFPDVIDRQRLREEAFTNQEIARGIFENPQTGDTLEIPFGETGAVMDRKRYGEIILEEAERCGADVQYDTVVRDVQQSNGRVTGVEAVRNGTPTVIDADVVIDTAGALSIMQDAADFSEATFDTNVTYSQFCSAYREIVTVPEPVEWSDAIYFKPTEELGYLWYFPRTPTSMSRWLKLKTVLRTIGHWSLLIELYRVNEQAKALRDRYDAYPDSPADFDAWQAERDAIVNRVYAVSGALPTY